MIIPKITNRSQTGRLSRQERREGDLQIRKLKKKKQKLFNKLKGVNLDVEFTNQSTTLFGNFALIETFKRSFGIKEIIRNNLSIKKHWNSTYFADTLVDYMTDCCVLGMTRFEHMEGLKYDPGYKKVKGIEDFPSEGRFRDLMGRVKETHIKELLEIIRKIIEMKSFWEGAREVWFDHDDSVITLFGNQREGEVGYNPRYKGRPSYKAKVCFIAGSDELLNLDLYPGKTHSNGSFLEFHKICEQMLPRNYVLKGVRGDNGFFDEENVDYFEEKCLEYLLKMKMTKRLMTQILALAEEQWHDLSSHYSIAEMEYLPSGWKFPRRVVLIREKIVKETGQMYLPCNFFYKYQAIMTNQEQSPEEVWRFYNKRANVENKIDEIKDGFGVDETSQHEMLANRAFALIKAISYNIVNWFKKVTMPEENYEVETVRRKVLCVPGNVVGNKWYRRIRLAANRELEKRVQIIKTNLDRFIGLIAYGHIPLQI
ncbi:MAG: IS1380 family transposase [Planctomycetota bacterium]|jgi:hypothetical protein